MSLSEPSQRNKESAACLNCGALVERTFCPDCGQRRVDGPQRLKEFVTDAFGSVFSFDSRVVRTIKPLFIKPGFLTHEYCEGRRETFVPPVRLYLFASFVAFLILGLFAQPNFVSVNTPESTNLVKVGWTDEDGQGASSAEELRAELEGLPERQRWFLEKTVLPLLENPEGVTRETRRRMPFAVFLLVPLVAVLTRVLYRKSRSPYYVQHLVFALHLHAFALLVITAERIVEAQLRNPYIAVGLLIWLMGYSVFALKSAFGGPWWKTVLKWTALAMVYMVLLSVVLTGALASASLTTSGLA